MKLRPRIPSAKALLCVQLLCAAALCSTAFDATADEIVPPAPRKVPEKIATTCGSADALCPRARQGTRLVDPVVKAPAAVPKFRADAPMTGTRNLPDVEFQDNDVLLRRLADMRTLPVMTRSQSDNHVRNITDPEPVPAPRSVSP